MNERRTARRRLVVGGIASLALAGSPPATLCAVEAATLERIDDLRPLLAQARRDRIPLLLFFSTPGCPYCIEVRRNYLLPRARDPRAGLLIREIEIVGRRTFADADGSSISESQFATRFGARVVPVVQLVDDRLNRLGNPLVGLDAAGFYDAYLDNAIEAAKAAMRAR